MAHAATEIVAAVGLAPTGDLDAVRWIAVRHADNHIHIVATRVRRDGRTTWPRQDYYKAQATCRELEQCYHLRRVNVDPARRRHPHPAEINKATRQRRNGLPRHHLRDQVRTAADAATDEQQFFDLIRAAGILVRYRTTHQNKVSGYAVGQADHRSAAGGTIWYGGGQLADDLTLPKLRRRWHADPESSDRICRDDPPQPPPTDQIR